MERQSFGNLESISKHPKNRHMVQTIKFFPRLLSPDLFARDDYEACVKVLSYTGHDYVQMFLDSDGNRKLSQQQLDDGFAEYLRLYNEECQIIDKAEGLLYSALSWLRGLWWLSIGFVDEILDKGLSLSQLGRIGDMARKTLLVEPCSGWTYDVSNAECAAMIFRTLVKSELRLRTLDLCSSYGTLGIHYQDLSTNNYDLTHWVLAPLKNIRLSLYSVDPDEIKQALEAGYCRKFLQCAKDLEVIEIKDASFAENTFHDVFSTFRWERLHTLVLIRFRVGSKGLTDLFQRHSLTLDSIELRGVTLSSGSWFQILSEIRRWGTLRRLALSDLCCDDREEQYFPGGWPYDLSEPIIRFMYHGGPWPSQLPQGLLREVDEEA